MSQLALRVVYEKYNGRSFCEFFFFAFFVFAFCGPLNYILFFRLCFLVEQKFIFGFTHTAISEKLCAKSIKSLSTQNNMECDDDK